jgi:hypothetical protein
MSAKGSNGQQDGEAHVAMFLQWQAQVEDFKPYVYQGLLSKSKVAREVGILRDVLYTNPEIRDNLWPALEQRLEKEGVLRPRVANPVEMMPVQHKKSAASEARIKQIQEENEALRAENRELRKQLDRYGGMEEVLRTTGRLPW